jgi:S1-C subfamily serine protease
MSHGSSGGELFDEEARLIVVATFGIMEGQGLNFALPSEWVQAITTQPTVVHPRTSPQQPRPCPVPLDPSNERVGRGNPVEGVYYSDVRS